VWSVPAEGAFKSDYSEGSMIRGREDWKRALETRGAGILSGPGMLAIDTLRFVLNREVEEVYAKADLTDAAQQETWASALLTFSGGVQVHFECSRRTPFAENAFVVYGSKGRASVRGFTPWDTYATIELRTERGTLVDQVLRANMYVAQIEAFNACVRDKREPNASGLDGWREREVSLAIRRSALNRAAVRIPPIELLEG
jgi:predicted dehydrogenase